MTCSELHSWPVMAPELKPIPAWVLTQYWGATKFSFLIFFPKTGSHDFTLVRMFLDAVSVMAAPESNAGEGSTLTAGLFGCIRENDHGFCNLASNHHFEELSFRAKLFMWFSASLLWNITLRLFKESYVKGYYYSYLEKI